MTLKVLQIIGSMHFGGAEKVVQHLVNLADRGRILPAVCCTKFIGAIGEKLRTEGVHVSLTAPRRHQLRHFGSLKLLAEIRGYRADVIHTHGIEAITSIGPLAWAGLAPPWVHTFHYGNYPYANERWMLIERAFSRRASMLIAVSNAQRESLIQLHRTPPARIGMIPNGVLPVDQRRDSAAVAARKQSLGIPEGKTIVGTVAVLSEQKGITFLLDAAARIVPKYPMVHFLIVGGGPLEVALRARADALGLSGVVTFAGWRDNVAEFFPMLDVYVMPSLWEAMPLALLEAMAAERPIIVTDVGDNAIVIENRNSGILVPPRDVESLVVAIGELLDDPARASRLAASARQRFERHYSAERMVRAYEQVYETLGAG